METLGDTAVESAPDGTKLLAVSGQSEVLSYYVASKSALSSESTEQWVSDAVTGGLYIALESLDNIPKVLFRGAVWLLGPSELLDAAADGANVSYTFQPKENVDCGIIVFYPQTGVVETYNAIQNRNSELVMLWTSDKPDMTYF